MLVAPKLSVSRTRVHPTTKNTGGWVTAQRQPVRLRVARGTVQASRWVGGARSLWCHMYLPPLTKSKTCSAVSRVGGRSACVDSTVATECALGSPSECLPLKISPENE